ncbi:N-acetylmuramate alpha-1-phosphate uridylyltransferase MurU [Azoarcus olearius]|uniref:Nucleotidyltransferase n=1 Tax=Azoarcus sp. (strain BH72) TaxID=418699 RepID=A1K9K0_AZOSB|nr:nucleotidyltransferase family protein [Azoarcus olearius]ANQ86057.1 nucleotidyltransferase [Azoarcus olearius]CAL95505.1 Nucleotidyltransferase [Azoarcus olearius]
MRAMIFAAGRGERMRPLTDTCPKPLLAVGGKPLIAWQIEALARAGIADIVINHAWLGEQIEATLGDGGRFGVRLHYSAEGAALETAGGIAQALPLLRDRPDAAGEVFLAVSGDIYCDYDYRRLLPRAAAMATSPAPLMHLVMVPNPPFHPGGDFALGADGRLALDGPARLTFGNIGLYDTRLFADIRVGDKVAMTPYYRAAIAAGHASGERFDGRWENVGTPAQLAALDRSLAVEQAPPAMR